MKKEIKKGDTFICIKTVKMEYNKEIAYKKGFLYRSENNGCITNISYEVNHSWGCYDKETKKHFLRLKNQ